MTEREELIALLASSGVLLDDLLLLKPYLEHRERVLSRIAMSLEACRAAIDAAREQGKHVLYMPGSYDLPHAGHALHVLQAVAHYRALNPNLAERDIVVVALADDDALVASAKARKHVGRGGTETFARPVQSAEAVPAGTLPVHTRLYDLASIPRVDVAGFLPSPLEAGALATADILACLRSPDELPALLSEFRVLGRVPEHDVGTLEAAIGQYRDLLRLLRTEPSAVADAFRHGAHPWSVQSWQLFLHCYLGAGPGPGPIVRMVSHRDDVHGYQVGFIMHAAGIATSYLHEPELVTTSGLLAERGPEKLLAAKRRAYGV